MFSKLQLTIPNYIYPYTFFPKITFGLLLLFSGKGPLNSLQIPGIVEELAFFCIDSNLGHFLVHRIAIANIMT